MINNDALGNQSVLFCFHYNSQSLGRVKTDDYSSNCLLADRIFYAGSLNKRALACLLADFWAVYNWTRLRTNVHRNICLPDHWPHGKGLSILGLWKKGPSLFGLFVE